MGMDYFNLIKGSDGPGKNTELTFGDLLSECRESAKEKVNEADYKEDNDELNKLNKGKKKDKGMVDAGVNGEEDPDKEEELENDMKDRSKDPDSDVPPPPDEVKDNDSPMEMRKEYLGKSDETHFYFITTEGGSGDIDDLVIADQDGVKKYSAKEQDIEISEESIPDFLIAAIRDMMIATIERSIFLKYIYPKLIEEEPETAEEEFEEEELSEEPDMEKAPEEAKPPRESVLHEAVEVDEQEVDLSKLGDDELVAKYEALLVKGGASHAAGLDMAVEIKKRGLSISESKVRLFETTVVDDKGNSFDVFLMDDDQEATTISINGLEHTFDQYSKYFQDDTGKLTEEGLKELALDTLANLSEEEYNELAARAIDAESQEGKVDPDVVHVHNPQNESKIEENNKGNDMLDEKKTVNSLLALAQKAENEAKALRKEAENLKKAKEAAKAKKESVESDIVKTKIEETDVTKGTKALVKLAKDAAKVSNYKEAADYYTKLAEIESMVPAEAADAAEELPEETPDEALEDEAPAKEEAPEEEIEDTLEDDLEEDVIPKEDAVEEAAVEEAAVEEEVTDEKKAVPTCKKCGKKHWPFEKCTKAKKESKIALESTEDINETRQIQSLRNLLDM